MADTRLDGFVRDALQGGANEDQIAIALRDAGWMPDQIRAALAAYAPSPFAVPVPRPRFQTTARDAFLYLVMFAMLYLSAFHLGRMIFQFIYLGFPDPAETFYPGPFQVIRYSIATLIVAFPVFVFLAVRIQAAVTGDALLRASGPRRWLTFLTLAVAACIVVAQLIGVIYAFLSGDLTVRFVLKALTVLGIAGVVFAYYRHQTVADAAALSP